MMKPVATVAAAVPAAIARACLWRRACRPVSLSATLFSTTFPSEPAFLAIRTACRAVCTAAAAVITADVAVCTVRRVDFFIPFMGILRVVPFPSGAQERGFPTLPRQRLGGCTWTCDRACSGGNAPRGAGSEPGPALRQVSALAGRDHRGRKRSTESVPLTRTRKSSWRNFPV